MPLPDGKNLEWPPPDCRGVHTEARAHRAWWSGDVDELMATSLVGAGHFPNGRTPERRFADGPLNRRRFWARRSDVRDQSNAVRAVHAPLAGSIAATSADLLFGEPPDLTVEKPNVPAPTPTGPKPNPLTDGPEAVAAAQQAEEAAQADYQAKLAEVNAVAEAKQAAIEEIATKTRLWSRLLEGAETCAAVGGVYLRPCWDVTVADHPLLTVIDQGRAIPDFKYGMLAAVTFWEVVHRDGNDVWRHLERHEVEQGPLGQPLGVILHGLYVGTDQQLGDQVPLSWSPQLAGLAERTPIPDGCPRPLLVSYVPNVLPNRSYHSPAEVGRSDYAGCETMLDSLDEVWSSLMRDVRLAQARIVAADEFLSPAGSRPGDGKTLDLDQELFTGLNIADLDKITDPIKLIQPDLRVEEHISGATQIVEEIVDAAGYSRQTFGLDVDGQAESGTALRVKEKKTLSTLKRKRGYWTPAIEDTLENLMALDATLFGGPTPERPRVDWPDLTEDPMERAQGTALWASSKSISMEERVRARNPHWDEEQVLAEVQKIKDEQSAMSPLDLLPFTEDPNSPGGQHPDGSPKTPAAKPGGSGGH